MTGAMAKDMYTIERGHAAGEGVACDGPNDVERVREGVEGVRADGHGDCKVELSLVEGARRLCGLRVQQRLEVEVDWKHAVGVGLRRRACNRWRMVQWARLFRSARRACIC